MIDRTYRKEKKKKREKEEPREKLFPMPLVRFQVLGEYKRAKETRVGGMMTRRESCVVKCRQVCFREGSCRDSLKN